MKGLVCITLAVVASIGTAQVSFSAKSHRTISKSTKFKPTNARIVSSSIDNAAVTVTGNNLVVDFQGFTLEGSAPDTAPDQRRGLGVLVKGRNITIKNLNVRGYKVGLMAVDSPGLKIEGCDMSFNWKQHLKSTLEREDLSDWMSYHQNEKDEWLQYGAAIYLKNCDDFTVLKNTATNGQCGLMLMGCDRGLVTNNNFSFLSAIGLGMYRSSFNRVMHNKLDWCVRGYSHGVYNRGQDSAAILIYEQSHRNTFAYNSATHGGDGFFLWAGQSTMDTGKGGCNDNLVFANDFSHAPTNGIEATFSRNRFVNNLLDECWHGFWLGYSYDTAVIGNMITGSTDGIAWEHGQNNTIMGNVFAGNDASIRLWQNANQDPNWGYPKARNTDSKDYLIQENEFYSNKEHLNVRDTTAISMIKNRLGGMKLKLEGKTEPFTARDNIVEGTSLGIFSAETNRLVDPPLMSEAASWAPGIANWLDKPLLKPDHVAPLPGGNWPFIPSNQPRGRKYILVDEWGPYDFKRPVLWPRGPIAPGSSSLKFTILGPAGYWKLTEISGYRLKGKREGQVPGSIIVEPVAGNTTRRAIQMSYRGKQVRDDWGRVTPAGKLYNFGFAKDEVPLKWKVRYHLWDASNDPRTQAKAFKDLIEGTPIASQELGELVLQGWGKFANGVPANQFATVAETEISAPLGDYRLDITTDDGCRVFLDDVEVLSGAWKYQGPTPYQVKLKLDGKRHRLRVEHFQIDGYAALQVKLIPIRRT